MRHLVRDHERELVIVVRKPHHAGCDDHPAAIGPGSAAVGPDERDITATS
jgi:hypothetical protein